MQPPVLCFGSIIAGGADRDITGGSTFGRILDKQTYQETPQVNWKRRIVDLRNGNVKFNNEPLPSTYQEVSQGKPNQRNLDIGCGKFREKKLPGTHLSFSFRVALVFASTCFFSESITLKDVL